MVEPVPRTRHRMASYHPSAISLYDCVCKQQSSSSQAAAKQQSSGSRAASNKQQGSQSQHRNPNPRLGSCLGCLLACLLGVVHATTPTSRGAWRCFRTRATANKATIRTIATSTTFDIAILSISKCLYVCVVNIFNPHTNQNSINTQ